MFFALKNPYYKPNELKAIGNIFLAFCLKRSAPRMKCSSIIIVDNTYG